MSAASENGNSGKTPELVPQQHGGALKVGGNPGNKGGGRKPKKFATFLASLRESPDVQDAIEKAAKDAESRGFAPVLKAMQDYDPEKPGTKIDHTFLTPEDRQNRIAALLSAAKERAKSANGNGAHANGNGSYG